MTICLYQHCYPMLLIGLVPRMIAIMPEKIMKMQAWDAAGGYISDKYPEAKYTKWIIAGGIAGAATTVAGNIRNS